MKPRGFWQRAFSDWPAKVLSIAAALLLFFFYRLNRLEERFISVPLDISMNDEFVPASQYPRTVRLSLRGESSSLFSIQEDDISAVIDLSAQRSAGVVKVPVEVEKKGSALGIDPLEIRIDPPEIALSVEKRVSRIVPVTPSFRGYLETGYELVSFVFTPSEVEVAGPTSVMARVVDVPTDFIELTGRSEDFAVTAKLTKKDPLIILVGSDSVEFKATIQKSLALKTFESVEIALVGLPEGLVILEPPPLVRLGLQSSKADIRGYEPAPGALSVDLSWVKRPGTYTLPVKTDLPPDFTIDSLEPQSVTVTIVAKTEAAP